MGPLDLIIGTACLALVWGVATVSYAAGWYRGRSCLRRDIEAARRADAAHEAACREAAARGEAE